MITTTAEGIENEKQLENSSMKTKTETVKIKSAIPGTGKLMRRDPSARGAKRVTIASSEFLNNGKKESKHEGAL